MRDDKSKALAKILKRERYIGRLQERITTVRKEIEQLLAIVNA